MDKNIIFNIEEIKAKKLIESALEELHLGRKGAGKLAAYNLAKSFLYKYSILTLKDTDEIFIYEDGVFKAHGDKELLSDLQDILENFCYNHLVIEVMSAIRRLTYADRTEAPKNKICLENGILNLDNLEIEAHNPKIIFFNKLPVLYNPKADCPKIKEFLSQIVAEDDAIMLQEIAGYCIYKDYLIHKAFMFIGTGANGKSTFINVLKAFLGPENCAAEPLQNLETNRFAMSSLFGKLANLYSDLPARALRETSCFKMLTGQDMIPAEKKFKDRFNFTNYSKQIFSCNQIPKSPDDSDAFFRRWTIINFPNQFLEKDADKKLLSKLTTEEEMSGFLNFAIIGLKRLLDQGEFTYCNSITEIREEYTRKSDSVAAFRMDCILLSVEDFVEKKHLYTQFCDYCRARGYPSVADNTFHKSLQQIVRVEDYRPLQDGLRVHCWRGIKIVQDVQGVQANFHLKSQVGTFRRVNPTFLKCKNCDEPNTKGWTLEKDDGSIWCDICADIDDEKPGIKVQKTLDNMDRADTNEQKMPMLQYLD